MRKSSQRQPTKRVWFAAAIFVGSFISGLAWLSLHDAQTQSPKVKPAPIEVVASKKPRFEFYNVLPVNEAHVDAKSADAVPLSKYILQIAAVKRYQDADKLKAELVLLGFDVQLDKLKKDH